jgi:hypothetical protein
LFTFNVSNTSDILRHPLLRLIFRSFGLPASCGVKYGCSAIRFASLSYFLLLGYGVWRSAMIYLGPLLSSILLLKLIILFNILGTYFLLLRTAILCSLLSLVPGGCAWMTTRHLIFLYLNRVLVKVTVLTLIIPTMQQSSRAFKEVKYLENVLYCKFCFLHYVDYIFFSQDL